LWECPSELQYMQMPEVNFNNRGAGNLPPWMNYFYGLFGFGKDGLSLLESVLSDGGLLTSATGSSLKKAGNAVAAVGIAFYTIIGIINNINAGAPGTQTFTDALADTTLGIGAYALGSGVKAVVTFFGGPATLAVVGAALIVGLAMGFIDIEQVREMFGRLDCFESNRRYRDLLLERDLYGEQYAFLREQLGLGNN